MFGVKAPLGALVTFCDKALVILIMTPETDYAYFVILF